MKKMLEFHVLDREGMPCTNRFSSTVDLASTTIASLKCLVLDQLGIGEADFKLSVGDIQIDKDVNEATTFLSKVLPAGYDGSDEYNNVIHCDFRSTKRNELLAALVGAAGAGVGAVAAPALVTGAVAAAGFGTGGIVAGTPAAALMASYGGSVGASSACAILQSVGAAGLGTVALPAVAVVGAGAGAAILGGMAYKFWRAD